MGQTSSAPVPQSTPATCPVPHQSSAQPAQKSGKCPVDHTKPQEPREPAKCPVDHGAVNPDNQMPSLAQTRAPNQAIELPTERAESSIPRDDSGKWEYPSPQQFYNALVRKGWETPEEHVVTMVEIHNFLNEEAWEEVKKWERRSTGNDEIQLTRLKGRPVRGPAYDCVSAANVVLSLSHVLFSLLRSSEPPFDRHDWIVRRPKTGEEVRYVIDYYSAPPEPDGSPVFSLDVRPALDSLGSVQTRIAAATEEVWSNFRKDQGPPRSS
ncbi:hypothetical protein NMY22_g5279 [Coprinellus aureogranulatus]|nr:hypothetical protein NMY22_g5279 [Coprinellus aureogranulatus]